MVKPYFRGVLRLATAATLLYAGVAGMAQAGLAQSSAAPASAGGASAIEKHPKFEVISIRRHTAESGPVQTGPPPNGFLFDRSAHVRHFSVGVCASEPAWVATWRPDCGRSGLVDWRTL
jgi:hypothetical protein